MTSTAEEQSPIQAVEMVRTIRDAIYEETKHLSREELKDFFAREAAAMREESQRSQAGGERGPTGACTGRLDAPMTLDEKDRISVACALTESLYQGADPDAEEAWDVEIRHRVEELGSGTVETIPWTEVRKRLFRGFE